MNFLNKNFTESAFFLNKFDLDQFWLCFTVSRFRLKYEEYIIANSFYFHEVKEFLYGCMICQMLEIELVEVDDHCFPFSCSFYARCNGLNTLTIFQPCPLFYLLFCYFVHNPYFFVCILVLFYLTLCGDVLASLFLISSTTLVHRFFSGNITIWFSHCF